MKNLIGISGKSQAGKDTVGIILSIIAHYEERDKDYWTLQHTVEKHFNYHIERNIFLDYPYKHIRFASTLKNIVANLLNCTIDKLEDSYFKNTVLSKDWWYWRLNRDGGYSALVEPYDTDLCTEEDGWELIKMTPRLMMQYMGTECGRNFLHPNIWVMSVFNKLNLNKNNYIITDVRFNNEYKAIKKRGGIMIRVERDLIYRQGRTEEIDSDLHISETALDNKKFDYTIVNNGSIEDLFKQVLFIYKKIG